MPRLVTAADIGDFNGVRRCVERGDDINTRDKSGDTALHYAVIRGRRDISAYLIKEGAEINIQDNEGRTALHRAVSNGDRDVSAYLIREGADINIQDKSGDRALHYAASKGHRDISAYLIKGKANINIQNKEGRTALHRAVSNGDRDISAYLIREGADINIQDNRGWTALHWAARYGYRDISEYLSRRGADTTVRTIRGWTALHYAAFKGHIDICLYLIRAGASIDIKDNEGRTALHRAVSNGDIDISEYLIKEGADINIRDNEGWAALHWAAYRGHIDISEYLISEGADINIRDNEDRTAFHYAARYGHIDISEYLISEGADINIRDKDGKTPVDVAEDDAMRDIITNAHAERQRQQKEEAATAEKRKIFGNLLPDTWGLILYDESDIPNPSLVELECNSWEFVMASTIFGSNDFDSKADIVRIERVQNVELYRHYDSKRKEVASKNGGKANETLLKHGTRYTSPEVIWNSGRNNVYGFDFRYCNDYTLYGKGSYFTDDTNYAHDFSYDCRNSYSERQIFLALVAQGSIEQRKISDSRIKAPKEGCQSVRGPIRGSIQGLIVYEHHQSYPAYLVTYRMRNRLD